MAHTVVVDPALVARLNNKKIAEYLFIFYTEIVNFNLRVGAN